MEMPTALVEEAEKAKLALLWFSKVVSAWFPSSWLQSDLVKLFNCFSKKKKEKEGRDKSHRKFENCGRWC